MGYDPRAHRAILELKKELEELKKKLDKYVKP
jgi:hypothetical protein